MRIRFRYFPFWVTAGKYMIDRDVKILQLILMYMGKIEALDARFNRDERVFMTDDAYNISIVHLIQEIGELTGAISGEFKNKHSNVPWVQIKALRNVIVHNYYGLSLKLIWKTLRNDMPELKKYCETMLHEETKEGGDRT
jgi:uncharacterized protein with HEPN domain